ncbi:HD domain-containing protein [Catellatospora citrea]|uniref:HD domain-containing protein n=1 Tax=Catellatospora citrea TaxID=53366 RepID=UPI00340077F1
MDDLVEASQALARSLLADQPLGTRWQHVQAVAQRAAQLSLALPVADRPVLVAAAWLHDIGYSPRVIGTGLHALDGARYLQRLGYPATVVRLVAHHTGAAFEAAQRHLAREFADFAAVDGPVLDALVTADLTSGPAGQPMTVSERIDEIFVRYPADHPVYLAMLNARPTLEACTRRALARLSPADASTS